MVNKYLYKQAHFKNQTNNNASYLNVSMLKYFTEDNITLRVDFYFDIY